MKIENAPRLNIDKGLHKDEPIPVHVVRERRIVWNFLKHLESCGVEPRVVDDGDEETAVRSKKAVMELLFNLDEATVHFTEPQHLSGTGWVYFVLGNDIDVVSDYSTNLDKIISKFNPEDYA